MKQRTCGSCQNAFATSTIMYVMAHQLSAKLFYLKDACMSEYGGNNLHLLPVIWLLRLFLVLSTNMTLTKESMKSVALLSDACLTWVCYFKVSVHASLFFFNTSSYKSSFLVGIKKEEEMFLFYWDGALLLLYSYCYIFCIYFFFIIWNEKSTFIKFCLFALE